MSPEFEAWLMSLVDSGLAAVAVGTAVGFGIAAIIGGVIWWRRRKSLADYTKQDPDWVLPEPKPSEENDEP